jgi:thioesterase domain-containing protein
MRSRVLLAMALVVAALVALRPTPAPAAGAHVYLLKGLADVFSSGMDSLAARLRQRGIVARVASHAAAESLADEVIRQYRAGARGPVVIAGHSLGADAAVDMARRLNEARVPVALLLTFGPMASPRLPPNVSRAVNYYQSNSTWHGQLQRGETFRGSLANVNLDKAQDINHFNIEKADRIQADAVNKIVSVAGGHRSSARHKGRSDR